MLFATTSPCWAQEALGDGHSGALMVTGQLTVNRYLSLAQDAAQGATTLRVVGSGAAAKDLLLLIQMKEDVPFPDGGFGESVDLNLTGIGLFAFARVSSVAGATLLLEAPLAASFRGLDTQVVVVPEYTEVTITDAGLLTAPPWDGFTGGVLAVLSTGTFRNDGVVDVSGKGFRGGTANPVLENPDGGEYLELRQPQSTGARTGEGCIVWPTYGRGAALSGGGGGGSPGGGGGGGSHGGRGGHGGDWVIGEHGGLGGPELRYSPSARITLGGGGGSGRNPNVTFGYTDGTSGGGAVLIHARVLLGGGVVRADAVNGASARSHTLQCGGGGAGGLITLRSWGALACGAASANGGGGHFDCHGGVGAGGGGGIIELDALGPISCATSVLAGVGTVFATPASAFDPLFAGRVVTAQQDPDAGLNPSFPAFPTHEGDGGTAALRFLSTPNDSATCGALYRSSSLGPRLSSSGPFSFGLESVSALPQGVTVDDAVGIVVWVPQRDDVGTHSWTLVARANGQEAKQDFTVHVECPSSKSSTVGCGCNTSEQLFASSAGFLLLWLRCRRRLPSSRSPVHPRQQHPRALEP